MRARTQHNFGLTLPPGILTYARLCKQARKQRRPTELQVNNCCFGSERLVSTPFGPRRGGRIISNSCCPHSGCPTAVAHKPLMIMVWTVGMASLTGRCCGGACTGPGGVLHSPPWQPVQLARRQDSRLQASCPAPLSVRSVAGPYHTTQPGACRGGCSAALPQVWARSQTTWSSGSLRSWRRPSQWAART